MEITKESMEKPSLGQRGDRALLELRKESERPMSVPDPRSEMILPDRRPPCGPWKMPSATYRARRR